LNHAAIPIQDEAVSAAVSVVNPAKVLLGRDCCPASSGATGTPSAAAAWWNVVSTAASPAFAPGLHEVRGSLLLKEHLVSKIKRSVEGYATAASAAFTAAATSAAAAATAVLTTAAAAAPARATGAEGKDLIGVAEHLQQLHAAVIELHAHKPSFSVAAGALAEPRCDEAREGCCKHRQANQLRSQSSSAAKPMGSDVALQIRNYITFQNAFRSRLFVNLLDIPEGRPTGPI
jgi:hypothetical protein